MDPENDVLTDELEGAVAQYDDTLLFIGFNLGNGQVQFTIYPGYRFPADDRVHGHIGSFDVPLGTRWADILARVDAVDEEAQRNYRRCVSMRQGRGRPGARTAAPLSDGGADHIAARHPAFAGQLQREPGPAFAEGVGHVVGAVIAPTR